MIRNLLLAGIRFYQKSNFLRSPFLKALFLSDASCRFFPSCSEYSYQAIDRYGILHGLWLSLKRIIRCNPWNKGGDDPLLFRPSKSRAYSESVYTECSARSELKEGKRFSKKSL